MAYNFHYIFITCLPFACLPWWGVCWVWPELSPWNSCEKLDAVVCVCDPRTPWASVIPALSVYYPCTPTARESVRSCRLGSLKYVPQQRQQEPQLQQKGRQELSSESCLLKLRAVTHTTCTLTHIITYIHTHMYIYITYTHTAIANTFLKLKSKPPRSILVFWNRAIVFVTVWCRELALEKEELTWARSSRGESSVMLEEASGIWNGKLGIHTSDASDRAESGARLWTLKARSQRCASQQDPPPEGPIMPQTVSPIGNKARHFSFRLPQPFMHQTSTETLSLANGQTTDYSKLKSTCSHLPFWR